MALRGFIVGKDPDLREETEKSLRQASLVAMVSFHLAKKFGGDPWEAETLGLFHNIGTVYFCYAYGLLLDIGKVSKAEVGVLRSMAESESPKMAELLRSALDLPSELPRLYTESFEETDSDAIRTVHRAVWAADTLLNTDGPLKADGDSDLLGLSSQMIESLNESAQMYLSVIQLK
jgi:HD-like signal output (HDOD) protein